MILIKDRHCREVALNLQTENGNYDTYKGSTHASLGMDAGSKHGNYDTYKGSTLFNDSIFPSKAMREL